MTAEPSPHARTGDPFEGRWRVAVAPGLFLGWLALASATPLFAFAPGVSAWYPPAALLAAAVTVWGARALPPIILAASLRAIVTSAPGESLLEILLVSALLKVIYWAGARLLRASGFDLQFTRVRDVSRFALTFAAAAAVAALIGVLDAITAHNLAGSTTLPLLRSFWLGDTVAVFALAPGLIIALCWLSGVATGTERASVLWHGWSRRDVMQVAALPASIVSAAWLSPSFGFSAYGLCFLALIWIALVHGPRVAAVVNVPAMLGMVWSVAIAEHSATNLLEMQSFLGMVSLTVLTLGTVAGERRRGLTLLGESEDRYRRLVELLPDPLVLHEEGRIIFANEAAATVLGAGTPDRLEGVRFADIALARSRDVIQQRVEALASGQSVPMVQHTFQRIDGTGTVDVESISIPFTYQGRAAALTVARDVTARLRLEEELRQAQRMEAVGRLAGGVAHDFNNLLTVITSYSQLILASHRTDPALERDVREIYHAAERAAALTRQLLSFSRRQVLTLAPLDLTEVVRGTEGLLRRLIGPNIEVLSTLEADVGFVHADKGQLEQVVVNLAVNARDAMPQGGVLTLECYAVGVLDDPDTGRCATQVPRYAILVVRDTGGGIESDTMPHIFDPFFTTKSAGQGTGLGLATVHAIVQQLGGAVVVSSVVGAGTEFKVLVPSLSPEDVRATPSRGTEQVEPPSHHARVLLVEDDDPVRAGIARTLRAAGYDVVEAANGQQAVSVLEAEGERVQLILSDVAMPRMDGRQLAAIAHERWPSIPLVLMSGFADPELLGKHVPCVAVLQKPFAPHLLNSTIRQALEG